MSNANMPAMPVHEDRSFEDGFGPPKTGLTKREEMAKHMMISPHCPSRSDDHHGRASWAIAEADALLAELDLEKGRYL